jgi:hypothetical protein
VCVTLATSNGGHDGRDKHDRHNSDGRSAWSRPRRRALGDARDKSKDEVEVTCCFKLAALREVTSLKGISTATVTATATATAPVVPCSAGRAWRKPEAGRRGKKSRGRETSNFKGTDDQTTRQRAKAVELRQQP